MTYTIEIRDLTNEGKELNDIRTVINSNCEIRTKQVNILAQNHVNAMASYFKHLKEEIDKLGFKYFSSEIDGYDRISSRCRLYINDGVIKINISPIGRGRLAVYVIDTDKLEINRQFDNVKEYRGSLSDYLEDLEELMRCWEDLKTNINEKISICIEGVKKSNMLKEVNSKDKLEFFKNFTI